MRKKALTKKISEQELAWLLLNFNQKRGYYQARGEEEEFDKNKDKEFMTLLVDKAVDSGKEIKGKKLFDIYFATGDKYDKQVVNTENWIGKTKEFIVTTKELKDGTIQKKYKQVNSEEDWIAIKEKTQQKIEKFNSENKVVGVGSYIYDSLLKNPTQKIRGKLVKTIERKFYKEELEKILETQIPFHSKLNDDHLYKDCINKLYNFNEAHKANIVAKGFKYFFVEDIIFYQRPLKSKKSTISNCPYESRTYILKGKKIEKPLKCISKSHPLFQEFRIWQFIHNLRIYKREAEIEGKIKLDQDVTSQYISKKEDIEKLFYYLNRRKEIDQKMLLKHFELSEKEYRWSNVEDKKYPCNETRAQMKTGLSKMEGVNPESLLTTEFINKLWHIIYSVKDRIQYGKALETFARNNDLDEQSFRESFIKFPPFENAYGAYSEKAIKKLLPLMRQGKYWSPDEIADDVKKRITSIKDRLNTIDFDTSKIEKITDDDLSKQILKSFAKTENLYEGLNTYQASYAVYNRHSEVSDILNWKTPQHITSYLDPKIEGGFRQHSLRNPVVEKVVTETLRVVRDIWDCYGNGEEDFFTEIHLELGREMKNSSDVRKKITDSINKNTDTNERIKTILQELMNDEAMEGDVRPYSKGHQDILKLFEEGVYSSSRESFKGIEIDEIDKIRKKTTPSKTEINRYKLWLDQGYISPYTGNIIPLSKLFTAAYEIEHIIPRSRYFDDSLSNKIICESAINPHPYKGNLTAYGFIKRDAGRIVPELTTNEKTIKIQSLENYEEHCKTYFKGNKKKLEFLLCEEVPEKFINRQMNDSRYISKVVKSLLSNVVRENGEQEATSKNLLPITGRITSELKKNWGLNQIWDDLLTPRFERMNEITGTNDYRFKKKDGHGNENWINTVPDEFAKNFSKKRLDHRHHALDALIIACTTKEHVNYLNNQSGKNKEKRYDLKIKLCFKTKPDANGNYKWQYYKPWETFTQDAKNELEQTVVSFKQDKRVINKATNKYIKWKEDDGVMKKKTAAQKGTNWAIRKAMHDPMPYGEIKMQFDVLDLHTSFGKREFILDDVIKDQINEVFGANDQNIGASQKYVKSHSTTNKYGFKVTKARFAIKTTKYGKRQPINKITAASLNKVSSLLEKNSSQSEVVKKAIMDAVDEVQKSIWKVGDLQLQKDLEKFLYKNINDGNIEYALFSSDGIDKFNLERKESGKHPVFNVRFVEDGDKRFDLGESYYTEHKKMEATEGNNMFFNIYWDEENEKRNFETVPLIEVIRHQKEVAKLEKQQRTEVPTDDSLGKFLFALSPEDLVYVPSENEVNNPSTVNFKSISGFNSEQIYKMVSSTKNQCFFVPYPNATEIKKNENGSNSKSERIQNLKNIEIMDDDEKDAMIKRRCWKLKSDRLGNITRIEI
ncbi:type II CRISPR RNA-guided endonuclease Cas9 [Gramella sp. AN32]|uniref:CRISPR-associated endonuclease Cas9 n=1 Tax=Christiangramia antarctica TaxID=2058158 RepID=A0ABW5XB74_9FLAO|nr:type II CRISPR RNA-guided endonuclease Cas9 [Gramella sp. AN32]